MDAQYEEAFYGSPESMTVKYLNPNFLQKNFQLFFFLNLHNYFDIHVCLSLRRQSASVGAKNTEAWKGRLKRFFVDPYTVELAKNGTNII